MSTKHGPKGKGNGSKGRGKKVATPKTFDRKGRAVAVTAPPKEVEPPEAEGVALPETTAGQTTTGRRYLTAKGHEVLVMSKAAGHVMVAKVTGGRAFRVAASTKLRGPVPGGAEPNLDTDEDPTFAAHHDELAAAAEATPKAKAPRARDPRLPEAGTPVTRKWRGHEVVVTEQDDGTFALVFDGEALGTTKSLTRAAEVALAREGIVSGVNGFTWFKVGVEAKAPRPRKGRTIEALAAEVERLQARFAKDAERAAKAAADLEAATKALAAARAAQPPAA
jgi:hypothetical protein